MRIKHGEVRSLSHRSCAYLVVDASVQLLAVLPEFRYVVYEDVFDQNVTNHIEGSYLLRDRTHGILQLFDVLLVEALYRALKLPGHFLDGVGRNYTTCIVRNLLRLGLLLVEYLPKQRRSLINRLPLLLRRAHWTISEHEAIVLILLLSEYLIQLVHRLDCFFNLFDGDYNLIVVVNLVIQDLPDELIANLSLLVDALFQNGAGIDLHQVFVLCLDGLGK